MNNKYKKINKNKGTRTRKIDTQKEGKMKITSQNSTLITTSSNSPQSFNPVICHTFVNMKNSNKISFDTFEELLLSCHDEIFCLLSDKFKREGLRLLAACYEDADDDSIHPHIHLLFYVDKVPEGEHYTNYIYNTVKRIFRVVLPQQLKKIYKLNDMSGYIFQPYTGNGHPSNDPTKPCKNTHCAYRNNCLNVNPNSCKNSVTVIGSFKHLARTFNYIKMTKNSDYKVTIKPKKYYMSLYDNYTISTITAKLKQDFSNLKFNPPVSAKSLKATQSNTVQSFTQPTTQQPAQSSKQPTIQQPTQDQLMQSLAQLLTQSLSQLTNPTPQPQLETDLPEFYQQLLHRYNSEFTGGLQVDPAAYKQARSLLLIWKSIIDNDIDLKRFSPEVLRDFLLQDNILMNPEIIKWGNCALPGNYYEKMLQIYEDLIEYVYNSDGFNTKKYDDEEIELKEKLNHAHNTQLLEYKNGDLLNTLEERITPTIAIPVEEYRKLCYEIEYANKRVNDYCTFQSKTQEFLEMEAKIDKLKQEVHMKDDKVNELSNTCCELDNFLKQEKRLCNTHSVDMSLLYMSTLNYYNFLSKEYDQLLCLFNILLKEYAEQWTKLNYLEDAISRATDDDTKDRMCQVAYAHAEKMYPYEVNERKKQMLLYVSSLAAPYDKHPWRQEELNHLHESVVIDKIYVKNDNRLDVTYLEEWFKNSIYYANATNRIISTIVVADTAWLFLNGSYDSLRTSRNISNKEPDMYDMSDIYNILDSQPLPLSKEDDFLPF